MILKFTKAGLPYYLNVKELVYAEADDKICYAYFSNGEQYTYSYGLVTLQEEVKKSCTFVRAHRSYLFNLSYFLCCKLKKAVLTTGKRLPLSRNKIALLKRYQRMKKKR